MESEDLLVTLCGLGAIAMKTKGPAEVVGHYVSRVSIV